jgi:hypothetical protein
MVSSQELSEKNSKKYFWSTKGITSFAAGAGPYTSPPPIYYDIKI